MKKYVLRVKHSSLGLEETFDSFEELKEYLVKNTKVWFSWINYSVDDPKDYRVLPNFEDVETLREINSILGDYDYSWWSMAVEEVEDVKYFVSGTWDNSHY